MTQSNEKTQNASERSFNETQSQVSNSSNTASMQDQKDSKDNSGKKTRKRSSFYIAREKAVTQYEKALQVFETLGEPLSDEKKKDILKKCLLKALSEMKTYNEEGFMKNLSMRMARLINDKRFDRSCKRAHQALWKQAELLAWTNESTFQSILADGIDHVSGFATPNVLLYSIEELKTHLLFNDVIEDDLDGRYEKSMNAKAEEEKSDAA